MSTTVTLIIAATPLVVFCGIMVLALSWKDHPACEPEKPTIDVEA